MIKLTNNYMTIGAVAAILMTSMFSSAQDVTIRKSAAADNPPLYVRNVQGPAEVRRQLENVLQRCGWFELVAAPERARYVLDASYARSGAAALKVRVSSGGREMVSFTRTGKGAAAERVVYAAVDTLIEKIFGNPGPCDSRIAFVLGQGGRKEIFTCNFDGTGARQFTRNGTISTEPDWGPDGTQLVYTLYNRNRTSVILADVARGRQRHVAAFPGLNSGATIAPGKNRIVLSLSVDRQVDLYTVTMNGKPEKRLTKSVAVESSPCWSADGSQVCFVSDAAGRPRLYVMPLGGGRTRRLLRNAAEQVSPDWSAVSNKICFSTRRDGQYVIAVADMNEGGGAMKVVTTGAGDWEAPSWAPDGRHLVCVHTHGDVQRLCMVDTLSGRVVPIIQKRGISLPSWGG